MNEPQYHAERGDGAEALLLIQSGCFTVIADGKRIRVRAGDAVLFRPRAAHGAVSRDGEKPLLVLHGCPSGATDDRERGSAEGAIRRATCLIHARYTEELTAATVCAEVGMSYSHFSRTFRRLTGESFRKYLSRIRLGHAERLLLTTDRSVTEIALDCGYGSVSYFCMQFKAHRGVSPTEYRTARR